MVAGSVTACLILSRSGIVNNRFQQKKIMQITTTTDSLQEAIRIVTRLAPPVSGNVAINSDGKKFIITSNSETSSCSVILPGEVEGKANTFAVGIQSIRDATKGRKELVISYDKTLCKIKSGNYRCDLPTVDAMQIEEDTDAKEKKIKVSSEQAVWLRQMVSTVGLKPTTLVAAFMPLSVKFTKKGAFIACYDINHMSFVHSKELVGDMEVSLPLDMFASVLDAFKGEFKMELSRANLHVSSKTVKVVMALPQVEENALQLQEVIDVVKGLKDSKSVDLEVEKEAFTAFLDNARAVATKERSEVQMKIGEGKLSMAVVTANGAIRAAVKATKSKKVECMIDFEFLDEAVRKSQNTVKMRVVEPDFVAFDLKVGTVIVSLNQDQESANEE